MSGLQKYVRHSRELARRHVSLTRNFLDFPAQPANFARQSLVANFQYPYCDVRDSVRTPMRPVRYGVPTRASSPRNVACFLRASITVFLQGSIDRSNDRSSELYPVWRQASTPSAKHWNMRCEVHQRSGCDDGSSKDATYQSNFQRDYRAAYARFGRGCCSDMEQFAPRGAKSFVSGGSHISRRVHKIAACSFPARQAFTHCGPIRRASRNAGARQPGRLARVLLVSTPARGGGR